ncbi:hypothetical protein K443DRAFT_681479 [Laccaria amethystina LaAM-08-1]|uniref:Uncharacterized protein n=1 Tax=Laccaria amethystina LaAM-08-1 TaxID=1095629 RepID=A0A0C9WXK1_9AGAR|nr:hypothetical protein K443DRAFT_681479 [Laccaria amethystina LaAM-08-1]
MLSLVFLISIAGTGRAEARAVIRPASGKHWNYGELVNNPPSIHPEKQATLHSTEATSALRIGCANCDSPMETDQVERRVKEYWNQSRDIFLRRLTDVQVTVSEGRMGRSIWVTFFKGHTTIHTQMNLG